MRTTLVMGTILVAGLIALGGCSQNKGDDAMAAESLQLRDQLDARSGDLASAESDRRALELQNAELRRQLAEANARMGEISGQPTGFEGIEGVYSEFGANSVMVSIENDILFDAGKNSLKTNAQSSLEKVASVISSQYGGRPIEIRGHTDTDPIKKSGWKSNYHLGAERAYAVMDYLRGRGLSESLMHISSFGPNQPLATKATSRRVEIIVHLGS